MTRYKFLLIFLVGVFLACNKQRKTPYYDWNISFNGLGSSSSPRAVDLNEDGVLDVVIGTGKLEFQPTDTAIIALNGKNGTLLWAAAARDQIFGSPQFLDITGDQIPDVFIGGRSAELRALNGNSGETIWTYFRQAESSDNSKRQLFNFYNPQFIQDLDADGFPDILIANGGDIRILPNDDNRPPGRLMLISSKTGKLIAEAYMPDGRETYLSCIAFRKESETYVIYGSGGETMPGKLLLTNLQAILEGDLSGSVTLAKSRSKGFIAPPVLVDITGDDVKDIIANAVDGRTIAIDGKSLETLWEFSLPNTELYCSLAVGFFDEDNVPDFFTNFGIGQFPDLRQSIQVALSGRDGSVIHIDSLGGFHYASPLAYDLDEDGLDEVFYHVNETPPGSVKNVLKIFDFGSKSVRNFSTKTYGANIGSTPLLQDLNKDGLLDIVLVHEIDPFTLFSKRSKKGLRIKVLTTDITLHKAIKWGSYMGSDYNGAY